ANARRMMSMRNLRASRLLGSALLSAAVWLSPLAALAQAPAAPTKPGVAVIPPAASQGAAAQTSAAPAKPDAKASAATGKPADAPGSTAAAKSSAQAPSAAPAADKPASQTSAVAGTQ